MTIRRERRDAVEHRRLILQTAQSLFNQYGVQPVSMHQIAKKAGIGQATLYRKYAHKGDLCHDILHDYIQQLMDKINNYLLAHKQAPPEEKIAGILVHWIDAVEEKSGLIIAMESKMSCEDDRGNFFHSTIYQFFRNKISEIIIEILNSKDSPPSIDPDLAAHSLICCLSPIGYFHIKQEKNYTVDEMKQRVLQLCRFPWT
ncbi:TetR/AcrR family transcriptional regulator [Cohnella abietis]|uniref:TetR family transcriptional regulator n=1 Tax=Cohnella abietis TaxID=2507935 RepID=A0A3T1D023_9BACL|nr:TetR/AcrR family transcriptional regulator [Cohnella abietis]BBI31434.1 TetR family transcriptional regulator [Cohnella abietis]